MIEHVYGKGVAHVPLSLESSTYYGCGMGRPRGDNSKLGQLNVRITERERVELKMLEGLTDESPAARVRRLIDEELERWRKDPAFQDAMAAREALQERSGAEVVNLHDRSARR